MRNGKKIRNPSERVFFSFTLVLYPMLNWTSFGSGDNRCLTTNWSFVRKKFAFLFVVLIKIIYEWNEKHALWDTNSKNREKTRWKIFYLRNKLKHNYWLQRTFGTWNMEHIGVYWVKFNSVLFHCIPSLCALSCVCVYKMVVVVVLFADL